MQAAPSIQKLLDELERLPGVGPKSAQRMAYWILNCASAKRDGSVICVVSEPRDIPPIERTAVFSGVYHVLGGVLAPMEGVGPDQLRIADLMARLGREEVDEVLLAMNPNIEGETTAAYLARLIKPLGVKVTRPASGLPVGGDLEFADEVTLGRALEGRLPL